MEREKEQMMREKEELMLRLQDFEQKTKKAEKGGPELAFLLPERVPQPAAHDQHRLLLTAPQRGLADPRW